MGPFQIGHNVVASSASALANESDPMPHLEAGSPSTPGHAVATDARRHS